MADDSWFPEGFDVDETLRAIREAEVLVVGFGWLAERLLLDARRSESAGPYIRVVQPVRTPQERLAQLRQLRPGFKDPESFVFFPWSGRVETFVRSGLWTRVRDRCGGDAQAERDCDEALETLRRLDHEDLRQAILGGEKYQTLWERDGS